MADSRAVALQPSLLDRLTDEDPGQRVDPSDSRLLGKSGLRAGSIARPGQPAERHPALRVAAARGLARGGKRRRSTTVCPPSPARPPPRSTSRDSSGPSGWPSCASSRASWPERPEVHAVEQDSMLGLAQRGLRDDQRPDLGPAGPAGNDASHRNRTSRPAWYIDRCPSSRPRGSGWIVVRWTTTTESCPALRELGAEFAAEFPKIAARLSACKAARWCSIHVERLLEGTAFLAGRVQLSSMPSSRASPSTCSRCCIRTIAPTPSTLIAQFQPILGDAAQPGGR